MAHCSRLLTLQRLNDRSRFLSVHLPKWHQRLLCASFLPNFVGCWMFSAACVCLCVCLFVCQHTNFQTSKHRMIKLGGRCTVHKSRRVRIWGEVENICNTLWQIYSWQEVQNFVRIDIVDVSWKTFKLLYSKFMQDNVHSILSELTVYSSYDSCHCSWPKLWFLPCDCM